MVNEIGKFKLFFMSIYRGEFHGLSNGIPQVEVKDFNIQFTGFDF